MKGARNYQENIAVLYNGTCSLSLSSIARSAEDNAFGKSSVGLRLRFVYADSVTFSFLTSGYGCCLSVLCLTDVKDTHILHTENTVTSVCN